MININKMKNLERKKRTTIRKQLNKRIMGIILGVFIVIGILQYIISGSLIINSVSSFSSGVDMTITTQLNDNISNISLIKENSDILKKIERSTGQIINASSDNIKKFELFTRNEKGNWITLLIKEKNKEIRYVNEAYTGEYKDEINEIFNKNDSPYFTKSLKLKEIFNKTSHIKVFIPLKEFKHNDVMLCIKYDGNYLFGQQLLISAGLLGILIIVLIITRILVGRTVKKQAQSIEILTEKMKKLSDLEGDLTQRIEIESNNEIGELAEYTNMMLDKLQGVISNIKNLSKKINIISNDFTNSFDTTSKEFDQINVITQDIADRISDQTNQLDSTSIRVNEINKAIAQVASNSLMVTEKAVSTSENAVEGNKIMGQLEVSSTEMLSVVEDTTNLVKDLSQKSEAINGIVDTITAIAEQTNLLALNASIEAARAGEQGRGFVVVAENVRKLAEESSKSAEDIYSLIQKVQQGIKNAGESMKKAAVKTSEEKKIVSEVSMKFDEIVHSVNELSNTIEEVSSSSEEMSASVNIITEEIGTLANISEENNAATEEISSSIDTQVSIIEDINEMAKELNEASVKLINDFSKLKV